MRTRNKLLESSGIKRLVLKIEESARATPDAIKWFIPPAEEALERATSKRHHIIFGRRGSGKSSLLRKAAAVLTLDRRPIAYIDLEKFKGNSYPNVLLSILMTLLGNFVRTSGQEKGKRIK